MLLKLTYKNDENKYAEIFAQRLMSNERYLPKKTKCLILIAKLTKHIGNKKNAIDILEKIQDPEHTDLEMEAKIKIPKYMKAYYANAHIHEKYKSIINSNRYPKSEKMYFTIPRNT